MFTVQWGCKGFQTNNDVDPLELFCTHYDYASTLLFLCLILLHLLFIPSSLFIFLLVLLSFSFHVSSLLFPPLPPSSPISFLYLLHISLLSFVRLFLPYPFYYLSSSRFTFMFFHLLLILILILLLSLPSHFPYSFF
jgi:hypothetical protein